ncbi:helix-turn-helix domain-containing protein [Kocuria sp. JC486]|uniref:helix-turn-helix domain-containing protein n=1 Tax=Kocuria sp. JC486 TaxID=1970736 RepID=UPI00141E7A7C|nr:helix-turn-helix transcriptional regulator [Kocuria sp. JC486]NHU86242.1 helix-turn-helix domain-containing protein [Kocuria sp. JC486]
MNSTPASSGIPDAADRNKTEIREFLVSQRGRISPDQAGISPIGGRRRVPGLRREEVANLAGVSVDYYTRIERGNLSGASEEVLDAIAGALRLDPSERDHLHDLAVTANNGKARRRQPQSGTRVRPELQYLLDAVTAAPAHITNRAMDMVAANALGWAMHPDLDERTGTPPNFSRYVFLDPRAHNFFADWERAADTNVAMLRREAGRNPYDKRLTDLVGELSVRSQEFRDRWAAHNVRKHYAGLKSFVHPVVGPLELTYQSIELDQDPGFALTVYPAVPGSASEEALRLLASWAASEHSNRIDSHR